MIFALVQLSAVSAVLAENRVAKREKVKNKPTEQRDVRDVESSEETGDYNSTEANLEENAFRRAVHLRKVKVRMKEQFVILKDFFFSDHIAPLKLHVRKPPALCRPMTMEWALHVA